MDTIPQALSPIAGPAPDLKGALRELVVDICDLEPVSGWSHARDLSPLEPDAVQLVLATKAQAVMDECVIDVALLAPLLLQSGHAADTAIAAHLRSAIELACREAIWSDVREVIETKNEQAWERRQERYYGGSGRQTLEEECRAAAQLKQELHR